MFRSILLFTFTIVLSFSNAQAADSIKVYAAASMSNVVDELVTQFTQETGVEVVTVFAGSSSLARQIENGAPADVYISANKQWVDYLVEKNIADKRKVTVIAHNDLVLIQPTSSALTSFDFTQAQAWKEALHDSRLAIGQPESVPAGIYAKQALTALSVWDQVQNQVAPTNSVRVALALVERGETALGVVYRTDALMSDKVKILDAFAPETHDPIIYPMVPLSDDDNTKSLIAFLTSEKAAGAFLRYGFKQ